MNTPAMTDNRVAGSSALVRSFAIFERAEAAKAAVVALGVSADGIKLQALQDEAGPVEGNFLVGNGRASSDISAYESNFAHTVTRGSCLLVLSIVPESQRSELKAALDELGGVDIDALARQGSGATPKSI